MRPFKDTTVADHTMLDSEPLPPFTFFVGAALFGWGMLSSRSGLDAFLSSPHQAASRSSTRNKIIQRCNNDENISIERADQACLRLWSERQSSRQKQGSSMLRQALVDAEKQEGKVTGRNDEEAAVADEESTPLTAGAQKRVEVTYGTSAAHARKRSTSSLDRQLEHQSHLSSDHDEDDEDDDDDYLTDEDDEDETLEDDEDEEREPNVPQKIWSGIKAFVRIVANVENLWDEETPPTSPTASTVEASRDPHRHRRRNNFVVLFWFVVLASSYMGERSTFKLLVDRAGPFRLVSVQLVTFSHAVMLGVGLLGSYYVRRRVQQQQQQFTSAAVTAAVEPSMPLGVPLVDIGLMALLDTVTLLLVFITGFHVSPTLTVLLVQFIIPLTAFLSQFMHPDGRWTCCRPEPEASSSIHDSSHDISPQRTSAPSAAADPFARSNDNVSGMADSHAEVAVESTQDVTPLRGWGGLTPTHVWGSLILLLAVTLALCPSFYSIANPNFFIYADPIPIRTAINTMTYVSSGIPAAASQLYKEHILLQYKQPVNVTKMNFLLSVFIFIFASIVSPIAYGLQGLGNGEDWASLYPSGSFSDNFVDGLRCFLGRLSEDEQENKYPEDADCDWTLLLVLSHAFCIIAIGVGVDKIVNSGATKVMYRGISAGIILATLCMHFYEIQSPDFSYGPAIDTLNLFCLVLMVLGAEVYHRTTLQESTFETIYLPVEVPTFEDY